MLLEFFYATYDQNGNMPLTSAALFGHTKSVKLLLVKKAEIEAANDVSNTIPNNFL
jgi:ankyrin repeat protein